jgi:hypothetical protein
MADPIMSTASPSSKDKKEKKHKEKSEHKHKEKKEKTPRDRSPRKDSGGQSSARGTSPRKESSSAKISPAEAKPPTMAAQLATANKRTDVSRENHFLIFLYFLMVFVASATQSSTLHSLIANRFYLSLYSPSAHSVLFIFTESKIGISSGSAEHQQASIASRSDKGTDCRVPRSI